MPITAKDVITSSGRYPERANSPELTPEVKANIEDLVKRVNNLLQLVWNGPVKISSGFRPSAVNASIPNAAKRSLHTRGKACDISDPDGKLAAVLMQHVNDKSSKSDDALTLFGLWLENPQFTKGWVHLDTGVRTPRQKKIFNP